MIQLTFMMQKEIMRFKVAGREIFYCDRIWKDYLRIIPKDEVFLKKIRESRNKIPEWFMKSFNLTEKDIQEYEEAKTEEQLADNIIRDCRLKGLVLVDKNVS